MAITKVVRGWVHQRDLGRKVIKFDTGLVPVGDDTMEAAIVPIEYIMVHREMRESLRGALALLASLQRTGYVSADSGQPIEFSPDGIFYSGCELLQEEGRLLIDDRVV